MNLRSSTRWIVLSVIIVLILWDIVAFVWGGNNATISVLITDWSYYTPWVPYLFGLLSGHLFFPAKGSKDK